MCVRKALGGEVVRRAMAIMRDRAVHGVQARRLETIPIGTKGPFRRTDHLHSRRSLPQASPIRVAWDWNLWGREHLC